MDATDSAKAFAEERDFANLLAGWTPDELRHAAQIKMDLARLGNRYAQACWDAMASMVAVDLSIPEDFHSLFGASQSHNRAWTRHLDVVAREMDSVVTNSVRGAGALLWLAEQRESGTS